LWYWIWCAEASAFIRGEFAAVGIVVMDRGEGCVSSIEFSSIVGRERRCGVNCAAAFLIPVGFRIQKPCIRLWHFWYPRRGSNSHPRLRPRCFTPRFFSGLNGYRISLQLSTVIQLESDFRSIRCARRGESIPFLGRVRNVKTEGIFNLIRRDPVPETGGPFKLTCQRRRTSGELGRGPTVEAYWTLTGPTEDIAGRYRVV
jgi:hypothetical protein